MKLLDVRLERLHRWHRPGLLCIGDAAHAMSPVFGINLAVQDAVAAARHLVRPLRDGTVGLRDVRRVQTRRWPTTVATQGLQRLAHTQVIGPLLAGRTAFGDPRRAKRMTELVTDSRWLNRLPAYFIAYGALRERPPEGNAPLNDHPAGAAGFRHQPRTGSTSEIGPTEGVVRIPARMTATPR
ncbi:FAD-dependent monooxygenase [Streptomyces sp. NBC_00503]|uniref:FAD-dependent monooxygenase n=1 Tax=Streptomyces sp. NBC_00503 TaxID=2903659 RepID=UPI002E81C871|nr:FAD-dependent monooxygenase [Streptomyces sp. NBC_00503]WUD79769.1 FAD-dependent monooxygenase [Streptomyces sp. NBC_00503]